MGKQGSKSLAYRINKRRLRHHQYGDPVNTVVGVITRHDQFMAWKVLSGQWTFDFYKRKGNSEFKDDYNPIICPMSGYEVYLLTGDFPNAHSQHECQHGTTCINE